MIRFIMIAGVARQQPSLKSTEGSTTVSSHKRDLAWVWGLYKGLCFPGFVVSKRVRANNN